MARAFLLSMVVLLSYYLPLCKADDLKPNIILILADDLGPGDLGFSGGIIAKTPNLDLMAKNGLRFNHYYSAATICSPSRTGLITGCFPARWQITSYLQTKKGNRDCEQADFLDPIAPSLPRILQQGGYRCAHFGKWHLGGGRDVTNAPKFASFGYDENAGTWESPEPHPDITATNWIWSPEDKVKRWNRSAFFVNKSLDFLKRNNRPCFINLWLDDPHTPWIPSAEIKKGETQANLKAVLEENDRQIGRLFSGLRDLKIEDKTLVIFLSDNGPLPTFNQSRTLGMRGSKLSLYEGGIRLPCVVHWPKKIPAGRIDSTTLISAVDFLPSLLSLAGVKLPSNFKFDGLDLSKAMLGNPMPKRSQPLFWEYGRNNQAFSYPTQKDRSPNLAIRDGDWKFLINADGTNSELYNLVNDPNETTNLASKETLIASKLSAQVLQWRKSFPQLKDKPN